MLDKALVDSYVQGQIGRRAFIRTLVRSGVSLSAAVAYAGTLGAHPSLADHWGVPDRYNEDVLVKVSLNKLDPRVARVVRGGLVQWDFAGERVEREYARPYYTHRYEFTDPLGFIRLGGTAGFHDLNYGHRHFRFYAAGTFLYEIVCHKRNPNGTGESAVHNGKVQSLIRLSSATIEKGRKVNVSWATKTPPSRFVYDVQILRPGATTWDDWRTGTTDKNRDFVPGARGTFKFRARVRRRSDNVASLYSPPRSLNVV